MSKRYLPDHMESTGVFLMRNALEEIASELATTALASYERECAKLLESPEHIGDGIWRCLICGSEYTAEWPAQACADGCREAWKAEE